MDERHARLLDKVRQGLSVRNVTSAELALRKLARNFPEATSVPLLAAELSFAKGDIVTGTHSLTLLSQDESLDLASLKQLAEVLNRFELYFPLYEVLLRIFILTKDNKTKYHLGIIAMKTGRVEEACGHFSECSVGDSPAELSLHKGHVYKALSQTDKAAFYYQRYIDHNPRLAGTGYWSLADLKDYGFSLEDAHKMEQALINCVDDDQRGMLLLAQARAKELQNQLGAASTLLAKGNNLISQTRPFNARTYNHLIGELAAWQPDSSHCDKSATEKPIFIVGLPRSGTTLTEQILASHSQVEATDELPYLERTALHIQSIGGYPKAVSQLSKEKRAQLRNFYLLQARQYASGSDSRLVDKNPNNFLHIGLIMSLFPQAKIINIMRPVLDNAVSLLRQHFSKGNDYAYSIEDILTYLLGYYDLTRHWQKCFGARILQLDYEQLVTEPEYTISQLLSYCGVADEEQCYKFYLSTRPVLTPSAAQVRKPISAGSLGSGERYSALFSPYQEQVNALEGKRAEILRSKN